MFELNHNSESEVTLDSLGSFFNCLIDIDYSLDDTGASQANEEEVTIIPPAQHLCQDRKFDE